ncbi:MAG: TonB-dependent receptor [Mucilaginibacter polytrichastri]|nr:TonB-dependent receptor [Mucilaginibacter polytrichastri]
MLKNLRFACAFCACFFLLVLQAGAQAAGAGKITGRVTDKKSGQTVIGATVKIDRSAAAAATDVEGRYTLNNIAAGKYTLLVSYVGYQPKSISDIEVKAGQVVQLDVVMEEAGSQQLQEVVIRTSFRKETVNALYAQQKNSAAISDGISADIIRKSPDKNTSEVLKRVSGTTIQDNKFVIIRGLSDRYNTSLLDNSPLPSTEPNRKAFSFDIVPSNLIENIVINKTATPDLPGDFAGGAVQILTRDIPDRNFTSVQIGAGYNSQTTFKDFRFGPRGGLDYLGFDDGGRALPGGNMPATRAGLEQLTGQQNLAAQLEFNNGFRPQIAKALPNSNLQFITGLTHTLKNNNTLGGIFSLTYRNTQNTVQDLQRKYYQFDYIDDQYKFSTNVGAMANFGYKYGNGKIVFKNLYNRVFDDMSTFRRGANTSTSRYVNFYAFDLLEKGLYNGSLEGENSFGDRGAKLKWAASYGNIINNQPDQRKMQYSKDLSQQDNPNEPLRADVIGSSVGKENARFYGDLKENIYSANASYTMPFDLFQRKSNLKFGGFAQYRDRDFSARFLGSILRNSNSVATNDSIGRLPLGQLFNRDLVSRNVYNLLEITQPSDTYTANALTTSGFAMLDNKLTDKLRLVWGLRVENFTQKLNSSTGQNPLRIDKTYLDLLPSANLTYSVTERANFRASYARTVARPEFRELAPFAYYDYELSALSVGDQTLVRTQIDNADLRYEFYPSAGQIISVSAFYKYFNKPIEPTIFDTNSSLERSFRNASYARNYGVEFEVRKSLGFINEWAEALQVYTNFAYIKSNVSFTYREPSTGQTISSADRPLTGQSPYVVNSGLSYNHPDNKYGFNVLYNRIGRRINAVGGVFFPTIWENPRNQIDFQANYRFLKNKAEIRMNISDVLNQSYIFYQDWNNDKKYSPDKIVQTSLGYPLGDETIARYKNGRTVSLTFSYGF